MTTRAALAAVKPGKRGRPRQPPWGRALPAVVESTPPSAPVVDSPYLDANEAVVYLRLPSRSGLYYQMRERALPFLRCGGRLRFDKRELDAWMRGATAIEIRRALLQKRSVEKDNTHARTC
jgi:hypothetical protein